MAPAEAEAISSGRFLPACFLVPGSYWTELGIAEREIKRVKNGKFVLLPASRQTHGHGTHTWAAVWQPYLKELLERSGKRD